jgi:hypothetical protein
MANILMPQKIEQYEREGYLCPFTAFPAAVAQSYYQKLLDFEQEIGDEPLKVLRIKVIPGGHRLGAIQHGETCDVDNILSRGQSVAAVDEGRAVDLAMRAGQFSIHHEMVVHGSGQNCVPDRRVGVSFLCAATETVG